MSTQRLAAARLPLTGERTVPGIARENYWFRRHEAVYAWLITSFAGPLTGGVAIEAGCGEGYGAAAMASAGARCLALDMDSATIAHVEVEYARESEGRLVPVCANLDALPLRDGSADLVVALQVIEHLWHLPQFLRECHRVLKPGAALIVSTPNRITFSPGLCRGETPTNPFHSEEFDGEQLRAMLQAEGFEGIRQFGLTQGDRIREWESRHGPITAAQVDAILSGDWPPELEQFVSTVTAADFRVECANLAATLDLIATGHKPPGTAPGRCQ